MEPTKIILVIYWDNFHQDQTFFQGMGLKLVTGSRYLGGFIEGGMTESTWLGDKVRGGNFRWRNWQGWLIGIFGWPTREYIS